MLNFLVCLSLSVLVEVSQLYQADWISGIRRTVVGALILGNSFVWTDLVCYFSGCLLAAAIDVLLVQHFMRR